MGWASSLAVSGGLLDCRSSACRACPCLRSAEGDPVLACMHFLPCACPAALPALHAHWEAPCCTCPRPPCRSSQVQYPALPTTTIGSFPQTPAIRRSRLAFKRGRIRCACACAGPARKVAR